MILLLVIILTILFGIAFLMQPKFGKQPSGKSLKTLENSPNFDNQKAAFNNLSETPALAEGVNYGTILKDIFFNRNPNIKPKAPIPAKKTDLFKVKAQDDVLVWFGHSSYFMQLNGKSILVDPVLSGNASPLPFSMKAFKGSDLYKDQDIPMIDYLFLSHDHWDHFDFKTITALRSKIKQVICGLGMSAHLLYWGFKKESIKELDWNKHLHLAEHFDVYTIPSRHFSGRCFKRNGSLWTSFILKTPDYKIFIGGDSGYDSHFKRAGDLFGPFDLAILENGQYDHKWKYIHMLPPEVLQATRDLKAKALLPVHNSKFALANHAWNEPLQEISRLYEEGDFNFKLLTPRIGEPIDLKNKNQHFSQWWKHNN